MNKVFPKPLNIKDFGKLMIEMKYIKSLPDHLKLESDENNF